MNITIILTVMGSLLLILLLMIYFKTLKKVKSSFTIGLLVFAILFLFQNLLSLFFYFTMINYYTKQVEVHVFIFTLLQTIAFIILLKLSWK